MYLPELRIGRLKSVLPIIQGGMAVRISTASLAAAVANEGGIGIIAASGMSSQELKEEIRKARALSAGIIGINVMYAVSAFAELFKTALQEGIDLVVSGAGFSRDMFTWGKEAQIPVVPIVSTAKLAKISEKLGAQAVIVEGKEAGGHLGTTCSVAEIVPEVKKSVSIPVIAAGGIVEGQDIVRAFNYGADGVQLGIRFAASEESNAAQNLKEFYVNSGKEDIVLIDSPVGLLGRALRNEFTEKLISGQIAPIRKCKQCLKNCTGNFCIMTALKNAQQGNLKDGLVFAGEFIEKIKRIMPVKEIIRTLLAEVEASQ
ncbi:MAG: nitronate monooxygenase [Clostridia bacterium]|nr:nitronate monooxygenase [Clostridia bacterium]MDD4145991.1 nitronate monooxygenase [Clostridia bacterium]MDD4665445.1 nitronate monooxygenase [Clostridia bacterium]